MKKRLISCTASDVAQMNASDLKNAIRASEGRVVMGETVVTAAPLLAGVTNAEIMAAFSADLLLLNEYDVFTRFINGMESTDTPIARLKELTGRPIGINLEPTTQDDGALEQLIELPKGSQATPETFQEAERQGIDFICLTGNPSTGVSNASIRAAIQTARANFSGLIFAGKMHGAGLSEKIVSKENLIAFIEQGADGVLLPTVGTVPGVREDEAHEAAMAVKAQGGIVMSTVGTSQESADSATIREFALVNKRVGTDIHHLGDGSYGRTPDPENLLTLSLAIRGKRHTYFLMSQSIKR